MRKAAVAGAWIALILILGLAYRAAGGRFFLSEENVETQVRILRTKEDADCIIIGNGVKAVMIDAGEAQDGERILEVLQETGVETLDALILTHPDLDHVGGASAVLQAVAVDKVIVPYYNGEKEELDAVKNYCKKTGIQVYCPNHVWKMNVGYVNLLIYPPQEKHYKESNNYSLAVLAEHGSVRMFFGGDALRKRSEELLLMNLPEVSLYKVPHHGRANSASDEMFEALQPVYAVVTSKTADEEIVRCGRQYGSRLLFSGEADVVFQSDGEHLILQGGEAAAQRSKGQ